MKNFRGPKGKIVRRFGVNIFESPKYDRLLEKRPTPPGMHGAKRKKSKGTEYGRQLNEKQKIKLTYGMTEKQFRGLYETADKKRGPTGHLLLQLLETKLYNVVFRAGFATTRAQARQLVGHGHLLVNGKKVDIPSFAVKVGDKISIRDKKCSRDLVTRYIEENNWRDVLPWVVVDKGAMTAEISKLPERNEIPCEADEQLVVELYSK